MPRRRGEELLCIIGREYEIKDVVSALKPYSFWAFVRWEASNYLEKQISAQFAVIPAPSVLLVLQIEMDMVQFDANSS